MTTPGCACSRNIGPPPAGLISSQYLTNEGKPNRFTTREPAQAGFVSVARGFIRRATGYHAATLRGPGRGPGRRANRICLGIFGVLLHPGVPPTEEHLQVVVIIA